MQTGDRVGGARIVGEAGKGAMGVVYRGRQDALGRDVAVKVIASEMAADPEFRARFAREARAAGALSHPHIVAVYDAGEDAGRLYLTMQFVDGVDLATMLRRHGPMPADDAVEVVAQIASALDAAHAQRLVHRDVKPANIMVTRRDAGWHTYLTDFGITTRLGEAGLTRTGLALGTLDYMAPEQLVGDPYDHRADVYALGAVLYQTLTGRVPFPRETDAARIYAHLNVPAPEVSAEQSRTSAEVAPALSAVVRRALAKQPDKRFASAGELADAARAAVRGEGAERAPRDKAYTPTAQGQSSSRPGRRALLLGSAGLVVAAGAGAAVAVPRLTDDDKTGKPGGAGGSASGPLGLPDDVPAARPETGVADSYKVGKKPDAVDVVGDVVWVNNRGDQTMTRIDVTTGRSPTEVDVGGKPHAFVTAGRRIWAVVIGEDVSVREIDNGTGALTGDRIPLDVRGAGYFSCTPDAKLAWVSFRGVLVRVDLLKGKVVKTVTLGGQITSLSLTSRSLLVLDQESHRMHRLDPRTGEARKRPLTLPDDFNAVAEVNGKTWVGAGGVGIGEVVGDRLPARKSMRAKKFSFNFDDKGAWGTDVSTSEVRRLKPDLTGTIGAPVTDLHGSDALNYHYTSTRLTVLDPNERTVRLFTITPLRRM